MASQDGDGGPPPIRDEQRRVNPYLAHMDNPQEKPVGYGRPSDRNRFTWRQHRQDYRYQPAFREPQAEHGRRRDTPDGRDGRDGLTSGRAGRPTDTETAPPKTEPRTRGKHRPSFIYGNYDNYYGYRDGNQRLDPRLGVLDRAWFAGRRVLDIGCNAGWLTVSVGMLFAPEAIEGVDIDPALVRKARAHLAFRAASCHSVAGVSGDDAVVDFDYFPASCAAAFGPLPIILPEHTPALTGPKATYHGARSTPSLKEPARMDVTDDDPIRPAHPKLPDAIDTPPSRGTFPANVRFRCSDWVHEPPPQSDSDRYDTILALSITKWIHLHKGDAGIRRFFQKCFQSLVPGGYLALEPQAFHTYGKRAGLTADMQRNYRKMRFKPEEFCEYLLGPDVGFESVREITVVEAQESGHGQGDAMDTDDGKQGDNDNNKKSGAVDGVDKRIAHKIPAGFRRPVYMFTKPKEIPQ